MNSKLFTEKFIETYKEFDGLELFWEDEDSLFILSSQLDNIMTKMSDSAEGEGFAAIVSEAENLIKNIENYGNDLLGRESLTEIQIYRIVLMNRFKFLFYQQIQKMKDDMNSVHFLLAEKLTQGALIAGLNGPYHQMYLKELLDHESLVKAISFVSKSKPVLEKYGKAVSDSDKIHLSSLSVKELSDVAKKVLQESPNEFLARYPEYRDGFLTQVK